MWRWFCSSQGVDYLKYDNCNNGDIKPLERCVTQCLPLFQKKNNALPCEFFFVN